MYGLDPHHILLAALGAAIIAAFVSAMTLRRPESRHEFHRRLHDVTQSPEHALTAILLVALGAAPPALLPHLTWRRAAIALLLALVIRPATGLVSPSGARLVVAFYSVRGVGSLYCLAYAGHPIELVDEKALGATIALTIPASAVVHGLTAGVAVERVTGERQAGPTSLPR